jgi:DNA-binding response OmpR family regulator
MVTISFLWTFGLPGKSGIEVAAELRAREERQKLRIIALTAHGKGDRICVSCGRHGIGYP